MLYLARKQVVIKLSQVHLSATKRIIIALVLLCAAICYAFSRGYLELSPNDEDGAQNLVLAFNLATTGIYGFHEGAIISNFREPLPNYLLALHMQFRPHLLSGLTEEAANQGELLAWARQINLVWAFICLLGVGAICICSFPDNPHAAASSTIIAIILSSTFFVQQQTSRLYTELPAATLLLWSSFALIFALRTKHLFWFALQGLLMAALILTKAAYLYVFIGLLVCLLTLYLPRPYRDWSRRKILQSVGILASVTTILLTPWILRNYLQFGSLGLTDRGDTVLLIRVYSNQMDILGGFFYYAPPTIRGHLGTVLGYSMSDADEIDGRVASLNRREDTPWAESDLQAQLAGEPENAIHVRRVAQAEIVRLQNQYIAAGYSQEEAEHLASDEAQRQAIGLILSNPGRHLSLSVVYLWRGIWSMEVPLTAFIPRAVFIINLAGFAALICFVLLGLWQRNPALLGVSLVPIGSLFFHALFTHFVPRYSAPLVPNMLSALAIGLVWLVGCSSQRISDQGVLSRNTVKRSPVLLASSVYIVMVFRDAIIWFQHEAAGLHILRDYWLLPVYGGLILLSIYAITWALPDLQISKRIHAEPRLDWLETNVVGVSMLILSCIGIVIWLDFAKLPQSWFLSFSWLIFLAGLLIWIDPVSGTADGVE